MRSPDFKGLTSLARVLRRTPRNQFDMTTWWNSQPGRRSCGCIAGWAAHVFPYRFKLVPARTYLRGGDCYDILHRRTGLIGTKAFQAGFRLPSTETYYLVDPLARHNTPKRAARAITEVVRRLKANPSIAI